MNIVIIEDSELIRDQLLRIIAQEPRLRVIGTASEEQEAVRLILDQQPDAVLLDLALAPGSGVRVLEQVRDAGCTTQVLVLSNHIGNALREACSLLGIAGFYDKNGQIKECIEHLVEILEPASADSPYTIEVPQLKSVSEREVFDDLLRMACLATGATAAVLKLETDQNNTFVASVGLSEPETVQAILAETSTLCGNGILEIANIEHDERLSRSRWRINGQAIRHFVCVPLILPNGEKFGAICIVDTRSCWIEDAQRKALKTISRSVRNEFELRRNILELQREIQLRRIAEEQAHHLATHDALTGLPNRITFTDRIEQIFRQPKHQVRPFAVLFIDLDKFKQINDTYGHSVGDRTLIVVAERLHKSIRVSDTVARLGGDEFVILLPEFATQVDVQQWAVQIMGVLIKPIEVGAQTLQVGASIGIAIYPDHGRNFESLLQHADRAMYQAKKMNGRPHVVLYKEELAISKNQSFIDSPVPVRKAITKIGGQIRAHQS